MARLYERLSQIENTTFGPAIVLWRNGKMQWSNLCDSHIPSLQPSYLIVSLMSGMTTQYAAQYQSIGDITILNGNIQATIRWMIVANRAANECGRRDPPASEASYESHSLIKVGRDVQKENQGEAKFLTLTGALVARYVFDSQECSPVSNVPWSIELFQTSVIVIASRCANTPDVVESGVCISDCKPAALT